MNQEIFLEVLILCVKCFASMLYVYDTHDWYPERSEERVGTLELGWL